MGIHASITCHTLVRCAAYSIFSSNAAKDNILGWYKQDYNTYIHYNNQEAHKWPTWFTIYLCCARDNARDIVVGPPRANRFATPRDILPSSIATTHSLYGIQTLVHKVDIYKVAQPWTYLLLIIINHNIQRMSTFLLNTTWEASPWLQRTSVMSHRVAQRQVTSSS